MSTVTFTEVAIPSPPSAGQVTLFAASGVLFVIDENGLVSTLSVHSIGGAEHIPDTLAALNLKVTDANMDDEGSSRPPNGAAGGQLAGTYPSPTVVDGADGSAVHVDVPGEIAAVTLKATPGAVDVLLIEDSTAGNAKRRTTVAGAIASSPPAVHALGGAEHSGDTLAALNALVSDATLDTSSASRPPSGAAGGELGGTYPSPTVNDGADGSAIHDDQPGEIAAIALKGAPVSTDLLLIEDSGDSDNKKRVTIGALPLVPTSRTLTAGAGLTGTGDLTADRTFDAVANADGSITVNPDDIQVGVLAEDAQHGARGGGSQHALAVASGASGFLSGAEKAILAGGPFLPISGGTMTGTLGMGTQDITGVGAMDAATVRAGRLTFATSTNTAALGAADVYACTDTSAARTLTISTSTIAEGTPTRPRVVTVTDASGGAGTNNVLIVTEGGQTIDGAPSAIITVDFGSIVLLSDGTNLTSIGGSGKTNAVDRVPLTSTPTRVVDVYSPADLPDAIIAPDGVLRVPLVEGTNYIAQVTFVWPRMLVPIGSGQTITCITSIAAGVFILFDGNSTPHIYGRNVALFAVTNSTLVDVSNSGAGRGTVLYDLVGGIRESALILEKSGHLNFASIGSMLDIVTPHLVPSLFTNIGAGFVASFSGVIELVGYPILGPSFNQGSGDPPAKKPAWSFIGPATGLGVNIAIGGFNMNLGDPGLYIDPTFTGAISITGMGYDGPDSGDFFRLDVSLGITGESPADKPVTSFAADTRSVSSVVSTLGGTTFDVGARHNWRVGDTLTHSGFVNAGYNGSVTITSIAPFTYSATAVTFVGDDTGGAEHDLSTLVSSAGHGLYRDQTILLGGATPGAYAGLRVIRAVEDDEDGFTIPVAFSVGGTGTIQITRVTTASDHPMVRGEQHTISGTAAYDGTRAILETPADDQFDISATFATDEGAVGIVMSATLDEKDLPIKALGNGAQKDSKSIGAVLANGNAVVTTITTINTWTDLNLNALAVAGSTIERWGSVDSTTGEVTYLDIPEFSGHLFASLSVTSTGGTQSFQFRAVVNGSPLSNDVVSVDLSTAPMIAVPIMTPIKCSTGQSVRTQVQNVSGTSNVLVQELSIIIS